MPVSFLAVEKPKKWVSICLDTSQTISRDYQVYIKVLDAKSSTRAPSTIFRYKLRRTPKPIIIHVIISMWGILYTSNQNLCSVNYWNSGNDVYILLQSLARRREDIATAAEATQQENSIISHLFCVARIIGVNVGENGIYSWYFYSPNTNYDIKLILKRLCSTLFPKSWKAIPSHKIMSLE